MPGLFVRQDFISHSGEQLGWKIECDTLTDSDMATLAEEIAARVEFSAVFGVPTGGNRLAQFLRPYCRQDKDGPVLIVDDVLTTGASMEAYRDRMARSYSEVHGAVIFARGPCPTWIMPLFSLYPAN